MLEDLLTEKYSDSGLIIIFPHLCEYIAPAQYRLCFWFHERLMTLMHSHEGIVCLIVQWVLSWDSVLKKLENLKIKQWSSRPLMNSSQRKVEKHIFWKKHLFVSRQAIMPDQQNDS